MAFTEKYVKVQSTRWDTDTSYVVDDQCSGSDNKNYYCIKNQSNAEGVDPPAGGYDEWWTVSDGTTEIRAWTFAEMIAAAPAAGTRVNMKAGSYTEGATTLPGSGTITAPIVIRGYSSSPGDLDGQGRGSDGLLDTTNMPDIAITSAWTPAVYCFLQNLDVSGALSSYLISSTTIDGWGCFNCRFVNTQNNISAGTVRCDDYFILANCDCSCTGASHATVVDCDSDSYIIGCRILATLDTATLLQLNRGHVIDSVFIGPGNTSIGIKFELTLSLSSVLRCTIYNCGTAIQLPNSAQGPLMFGICNCHITDCGQYIDNLYSATADMSAFEMNNRLRDVGGAAARDGILSTVLAAEITTDTGGIETDTVSTTNMRLIYGAPGVAKGMMPDTDIGAYQRARPTLPADEDVQDGVSYGDGGTQYEGDLVLPNVADVQSDVQFGGDGTEYTGTFKVPAVGDVQSDVTYGAAAEYTGTFSVPAVGEVESDVTYGAGGVEFTGTYAPSCDYPLEADVQSDVAYANLTKTGTFAVPAVADVQSDVTYGAAGVEFTGTFAPPAVADVQSDVTYGGGGVEFTGTFKVPAITSVHTGIGYGAGGVEFTGNLTHPAITDVQSDVAYGAAGSELTGTFKAPAVGDVQSDVGYGAGGVEFTGTFAVPAVSDVLSDVTYGAGGIEFTGTLAGGYCDYPSEDDVESDVVYASGAMTGNFAVPAAADVQSDVTYGAAGVQFTGTFKAPAVGDVQSDVTYGAAAEFTGTFAVPTEANVHDGIGFGAGGVEFTGNLTHPLIGDVQSDVTYGAGGVELTGTFASPAIGDVESDVAYGAGGAEFAGTFAVPAEADVESDVTYGAGGAEFTGTLAPGGGGGSRPAII
jgi:hypothetical protein